MIRSWSIGIVALCFMGSASFASMQDSTEKLVLDLGGGVKMEFVRIKAGKFTMGDKDIMNATPHEATITKDYWMQTTETTQAQWEAVTGQNPSHFKGADLPVECVSWEDCRKFLKRLNEKMKEQLKGKIAGLPTEAQWEYACRAGSTGSWCFGDDVRKREEYEWHGKNTDDKTHPVERKKPNAWGLYDMHGNVWEWCEDWYGEFSTAAVTDPTGPATGEYRCARGGSWNMSECGTESANRERHYPSDRWSWGGGLRVALR